MKTTRNCPNTSASCRSLATEQHRQLLAMSFFARLVAIAGFTYNSSWLPRRMNCTLNRRWPQGLPAPQLCPRLQWFSRYVGHPVSEPHRQQYIACVSENRGVAIHRPLLEPEYYAALGNRTLFVTDQPNTRVYHTCDRCWDKAKPLICFSVLMGSHECHHARQIPV